MWKEEALSIAFDLDYSDNEKAKIDEQVTINTKTWFVNILTKTLECGFVTEVHQSSKQ